MTWGENFGPCYQCRGGEHSRCVGVPCECGCTWSDHEPDPRAVILWLIAEDMYNDAMSLDGQAFTGRTVGPVLGRLQAAVMHLAMVQATLLPGAPAMRSHLGAPAPYMATDVDG